MPRKPLITAALATGVAISGAEANENAGVPDDEHGIDIVELHPGAAGDDAGLLFLSFGVGDGAADDLLPAIIEPDAPDDWEAGIDFAQTVFGGSGNDGIVGGRAPGGITLDNGLKTTPRISPEVRTKEAGALKKRQPAKRKKPVRNRARKKRR